MKQYEIVKIGKRHEINGEVFAQDVVELYPLDNFVFGEDASWEIYRYIRGIDENLRGVFPILEFEDGDYIGCVAVMEITDDDEPSVILSIDQTAKGIADAVCRDAYYEPMSKVEQWAKLMQIVEDNDMLGKVIDFVGMQLSD